MASSCPTLLSCVSSSDCSNGEPCIELSASTRGCLTPGYNCVGLQNCSVFSGSECLASHNGGTLAQAYPIPGMAGTCAVQIINNCPHTCIPSEAVDGGGFTMSHCE